MQPIEIPGFTRVLGASQGYIPLPVRDGVIDEVVSGAGTPVMETRWRPSADELAILNDGGSVFLSVIGTVHPPVIVGVRESADRMADYVSDLVRVALKKRNRGRESELWEGGSAKLFADACMRRADELMHGVC